jgi:hypothetical protein
MNKFDYEKVIQINALLNSRCNFMLNLINDIRKYLIECKQDKSKVDVDYILKMLD